MEAVLDLCLITLCNIVLNAAIIRWVNCCYKGMYVVSNNSEKDAVAFKQRLIAIKGPNKQIRNPSSHHYATTTTTNLNF